MLLNTSHELHIGGPVKGLTQYTYDISDVLKEAITAAKDLFLKYLQKYYQVRCGQPSKLSSDRRRRAVRRDVEGCWP